MTHTYAVLEVPAVVHAAVRALLKRAGYEHAFTDDGLIDMHGIALKVSGGADTTVPVTVGSLVSSRTGDGRVELQLGTELLQMSLDDARGLVSMLQGAVEAAISDAMLGKFLVEKVGLTPEQVGAALLDFREMRQGSRDKVYPS